MFGNLPEVRTSGPLFQFGVHFAEHLVARGHDRSHICNLKNLLRDLDQWLASEGLRAEDLRRSEIERFQAERVAAGRKILVSVRALTPLMEYLRGVGIEPQEPEAAADGPLAAVLQRYRGYLATERGLKRETAARYAALVRPFLETSVGADGLGVNLKNLNEASVIAFVVATCRGVDRGAASLNVTALRSVLAFLHVDGAIDRSLVAAVPTVPGRRHTNLPKGVAPADIDRLLASCDINTRSGSRRYAVLTMLVRLGLRAGELANLKLDDINWRSGELVIAQGKGNRTESLPLPADVGEALAEYLRRWRPRTAIGRTVFVRLQAPHRALTRSATSTANACCSGSSGASRTRPS